MKDVAKTAFEELGYTGIAGVEANGANVLEIHFTLKTPVRRDGKRVTHDSYNSRELAARIAELESEGIDVRQLKAAAEQLKRAKSRRGKPALRS